MCVLNKFHPTRGLGNPEGMGMNKQEMLPGAIKYWLKPHDVNRTQRPRLQKKNKKKKHTTRD